ncbi:MAG: ATP-binding protein [Siphonobacter sp.]
MSLRIKYLLFIGLIHLITIGLSFYILREHLIWFLLIEVILIGSVYLSYQLYQSLIAPLQLLVSGTEAIQDRDFNVKFLKTGKPEIDRIVTVYNAMIDQLRQERTLQQEQHYFLEKLVQTSPTGIIILNLDGEIEQINPKALQFLKGSLHELKGKRLNETNHPFLKRVENLPAGKAMTIQNGGTFKCEMSFFIDRGFQRYFLTIEELTAELLAAERNAYGKVIRMMSHEINNTLGAVNSLLDTTADWLEDTNQPLSAALKIAIARNDNLGLFTKRFAEVVRLPPPQKAQISLHELIADCARLMEPMAQNRHIQLKILGEEKVTIFADRLQLEQVLINSTKNAIEAIDQYGEITFELTSYPVRLIIANNGKDITAEEANQLFTPFFTNKPNGQGIGLTLIREILHGHGFGFSLRTVLPGRTEFTITF